MMANYEIVELIVIMHRLIEKFTISSENVFTDAFSKQRIYTRNLGYVFVSYFLTHFLEF